MLFAAINDRLSQVSRAIEAEVCCTLHCELTPTSISLKNLTSDQFHFNLQQLMQKGVPCSQLCIESMNEHCNPE